MRVITAAMIAVLGWSVFAASASAHSKPEDPCENANSNAEMRQCYARAQARVNAEAELLVSQIATALRKDAEDPSYGKVVGDLTRKSADALLQSQKAWKEYRDQYCSAISFNYTTGSGAGTAHASCLFTMGTDRVKMLRDDFEGYIPEAADRSRKKK